MNEHEDPRDKLQPAADAPNKEIDENDPKTIKGARKQNSRTLLWTVCGLYLLYLAYGLAKGLITRDVEGTAILIVSTVGCIAFTIVGVYLLVRSIRAGLQSFKASVEAMEEDEDSAAPEEDEADEEEEDGAAPEEEEAP